MPRGKVSKAEKIRETFDKLGLHARPKDVIATLADANVKVSSAQVSNVKATLNGGKRSGKAGALTLADLTAAKRLVEALGSVERAEGALAALAKLR